LVQLRVAHDLVEADGLAGDLEVIDQIEWKPIVEDPADVPVVLVVERVP
jgi:hypothetical protein